MSISTEITRIQTARNTIRTKLVALGLATITDKLDELADAIDEIENRGSVSAEVKEGETYTIPKGYHNGSGTVSGVAGGGNYRLQSKTATPTKSQQAITADSGYYGLSDVTVSAIPSNYQDVSSVTATATDILSNKIAVASDGTTIVGSMTNNGAVTRTLDATTGKQSYTIPSGYHNGSGTVSISLEQKTATPTESTQTITPTAGKVLSSVSVNAIPSKYKDTSSATATAAQILDGAIAFNASGQVVGTMENYTDHESIVLDTTQDSYDIPAGYHAGDWSVSINLEESKTITPTESQQTIEPEEGNVLSTVVVEPIPSDYIQTGDATATAANILSNKTAYVDGEKLTGTMVERGTVTHVLDATTNNQSFTIAGGHHNGDGTVSITLETNTVTPTKSTQTVTPTSGKVLSQVTVNPIPANYITTTDATAVAGEILATKTAYVNTTKVVGTMPNNTPTTKTLDTTTGNQSYTIPAGYHSGTGKVQIVLDTAKTITPTKSSQSVTPASGKVLSSVTVNAIPANYIDTTDATATAAKILVDETAYVNTVKVVGTMPNNGSVTDTIDGITTLSVTIPAGYTTGGTISLTDDIEDALAAI